VGNGCYSTAAAPPNRPMRLLFIVLLLLAPLAQAHAQTPAAAAAAAYVGRVAVVDQNDATRETALVQALAQVLERVSGRGLQTPEIQALAARAPRLVQRYSYEREPAGGPLLLVAGFNPRAVDSALRDQNLPVWGSVEVPAEEVEFRISGVRGIGDYARALAAVRGGGVRGLSVIAAEDDQLWLRATVAGGAAALAAGSTSLQRVAEQPLQFALQPVPVSP